MIGVPMVMNISLFGIVQKCYYLVAGQALVTGSVAYCV